MRLHIPQLACTFMNSTPAGAIMTDGDVQRLQEKLEWLRLREESSLQKEESRIIEEEDGCNTRCRIDPSDPWKPMQIIHPTEVSRRTFSGETIAD